MNYMYDIIRLNRDVIIIYDYSSGEITYFYFLRKYVCRYKYICFYYFFFYGKP